LLAREAHTFYPGRIRFFQASIVGFKSFSTAGAKPSAGRPIDRRIIVVPRRLAQCAIVVKPPTFVESSSRSHPPKIPIVIFSKTSSKARSKGPKSGLDSAVVEMKQRNPRSGCPRIAEQIALVFGTSINKDVVRRILAAHYHPSADGAGPSWLTFLGHVKDSLHSIDLFRCESVVLRTYWVLVVMDQCIRLVGFGIHAGTVDGLTLCPHVLPGG
jgi:putative transposase